MDIQEILKNFENAQPTVARYVTDAREYVRVYLGVRPTPSSVIFYVDTATGAICVDPAEYEKTL